MAAQDASCKAGKRDVGLLQDLQPLGAAASSLAHLVVPRIRCGLGWLRLCAAVDTSNTGLPIRPSNPMLPGRSELKHELFLGFNTITVTHWLAITIVIIDPLLYLEVCWTHPSQVATGTGSAPSGDSKPSCSKQAIVTD